MADYTFNINHKFPAELGGAGRGAARAQVPAVNEAAMSNTIARVLEKALGNLSDKLSVKIARSLEDALDKYLRRASTAKTGDVNLKNEIKSISGQVAKDISNNLVNALTKRLGGGRGEDPAAGGRVLNTFLRNIDKQIEASLGKINTTLQTKTGGKVQLDPAATKELSRALSGSIGDVISRSVPKESGNVLREIGNMAKTLGNAVREIKELTSSIKRMKESGGGIDLDEILKVTENFKRLGSEAKRVPEDFKNLSSATKKLVGEQKQIMQELGDAIKNAKREIGSSIKSATETPTKFLPSAKNVSAEAKKVIDNATESLKKTAKEFLEATEIKGADKVLKAVDKLDSAMAKGEKVAGKIEKAFGKAKQLDLPLAAKAPRVAAPVGKAGVKDPNQFNKAIVDLDAQYAKLISNWSKMIEKMAKDVPEQVLSAMLENLSGFQRAYRAKDPAALKHGLATAPQDIADREFTKQLSGFYRAIEDMSKMVSGGPKEFQQAFEEGLSNISSIAREIHTGTKDIGKDIRTNIESGAKKLEGVFDRTKDLARQQEENIRRLSSQIRGPQRPTVYRPGAVPATTGAITLEFESQFGKGGEKIQQQVKARVEELASSLKDLQDFMVSTLDKEFKEAGRGWEVVRESAAQNVQDFFKLVTKGNLKTAGKEYGFEIANVPAIKKALKKRGFAGQVDTPKEAVDALRSALVQEAVGEHRGNFVAKIAEWLKTRTKEEIDVWDGLTEEIKKKLSEVKDIDLSSGGVLVGKELLEALETRLTPQRVESAFRATYAAEQAEKGLTKRRIGPEGVISPYVRKVAVPAARLTPTGGTVFETARGSQRAIPQFATFKTGFERLFESLADKNALIYGRDYPTRIQQVGVRPRGPQLQQANELARDMLRDFAGTGEDAVAAIKQNLSKAAQIKAAGLDPKAAAELNKSIESALKVDNLSASMDEFIKNIEEAGVSAYDIVKALDQINFGTVYDLMKKVLLQPLEKLGAEPFFERSIRQYEQAVRQVVQGLPLVEIGKPRRGYHQEQVVNLLSRGGAAYATERKLQPQATTQFLQDLNLRLKELVKESEITGEQILKEHQRTISTLGVPESPASEVRFYRKGQAGPGEEFLTALNAVSTKLYTDILPELAPFGAQFTQIGRNIASVNNAISSSKAEIDQLTKSFGATRVEGFGTEFPALRTSREAELISGGRYGTKGFGFNVLTELRHTAGTMEDQILVSGKLADSLTSLVKTITGPSAGGRVGRRAEEEALFIGKIKEGVVSDVAINKVFQEFQRVLGVPKKYESRADRAFIDEVRKAITVVRGEPVEIQQARLTEVFLNSFGRKFMSRYGTKGVSVTPGELPESAAKDLLKAVKDFEDASIKVLAPEERKKAGLGVALVPRSMGELLSEVIDKYKDRLTREGFDVAQLQDTLIDSGNKFILDLFKTPGLVTVEEATRQTKIFSDAVAALASVGIDIKNDIPGIEAIKKAYEKEIPEGKLKKERAIDVRISSVGIGKRGLQPEFMEAIVNNLIAGGPKAVTTLPTTLPTEGPLAYQKLLGGAGARGRFAEVSKALGYETIKGEIPEAERRKAIESMLFKRLIETGKSPKEAKVIAERGAALESVSDYYTTIIDEFGKARKSIVGEKFLSIVEEPGQFAPTTAEDIRRRQSGAKINVPVFSAYASTFGEQSKLLEEIIKSPPAGAGKQLEFIKALQFATKENEDFQKRLAEHLEERDVRLINAFDEATGILTEEGSEGSLDPKSLTGTIFDVAKYPKAFMAKIPKATGEIGETEPFYVPAPLARATYAEELIAGERGFDVLARRLQHVINIAKQAQEIIDQPAEIQGQIEKLEVEMQNLQAAGKTDAAAQLADTIGNLRDSLDNMLSGEGQFAYTIKSKVIDRVNELKKAVHTATTVESATEALQQLGGALSDIEVPAKAFRVSPAKIGMAEVAAGVPQVTAISSERQQAAAFYKLQELKFKEQVRQEKGLGPEVDVREIELDTEKQLQLFRETSNKIADLLVGQSPQAQQFFDKVVRGLAEFQAGYNEQTSAVLAELAQNPQFAGKDLQGALQKYKRLAGPVIEATRGGETALGRAYGKDKAKDLANKLGLDVEQTLQQEYFKKLDQLQRAKIDYYNELAQAVVGKGGAISETLFSRTLPGLMQKAINATVDRTKELKSFIGNIDDLFANIEQVAPGLVAELERTGAITAPGELKTKAAKILEEHAAKVKVQRKRGFPVLGQHEIGISPTAAKKIPVEFAKKYAVLPPELSEPGRVQAVGGAKEQGRTLYDLLSYVQELQTVLSTGKLRGEKIEVGDLRSDIEKYISSELVPFVEAIRYPFTGVSSIVPYKAKLLTGRQGRMGASAFAVPGAPEMDIAGLNNVMQQLTTVVEGLSMRREALIEQADISGIAPDPNKIASLNDAIDSLLKTISAVIPKYSAHTAKLDFDGDQILVHSAATKEAREEIKKHYDTITQWDNRMKESGNVFGKTTQALYRDIFTAESLLSQQPTGEAILAEAGEAFYKKFPTEKGFKFLERPFLTEQLEFLKAPEKLDIFGRAGGGIFKSIEELISETITGVGSVPEAERTAGKMNKDLVLAAIEPLANMEAEISKAANAGEEATRRLEFSTKIIEAIQNLDKQLGTAFADQIEKALTSRLFEERYRDAVVAQLYKIQTGIETEALYRIGSIVESQVGFGGGLGGGKGDFKSSERFQKRFPKQLGIVGKQPEFDAQTFINEIVRFALQKGMDVKHAGEKPLAGELVKHLAMGTEGVTELWAKITGDDSYKDLSAFQKANEKAIKLRLGKLPTEQIRTELEDVYKARGTKYDQADLAKAARPELIEKAVEAVGLKAFLEDLALYIKESAIEGIVKELKNIPAHLRPKGAGDVETYARKTIADEIAKGGINIRKRIAVPLSPLYGIRRVEDLESQVRSFKERRGEVPVEEFKFRTLDKKQQDALLKSFEEARDTAVNLKESLEDAVSSTSGEAAAQLMRGSIEFLHKQQMEMDQIAKQLQTEEFKPGKFGELEARTLTGAGVPTITKKLFKSKPEDRAAEIERLAELAGLPTLGREEKFKIERELTSKFVATGMKKAKEAGVAPDKLEAEANKIAESLVKKAEIIYEMDRILDSILSRAKEGRFVVSLFKTKEPPKEFVQAVRQAPGPRSYGFANRAQEIDELARTRAMAAGTSPPVGGGGRIAGGYGAGGLGFTGGGPVPVYIVGMAADVASRLGVATIGRAPAVPDELARKAAEASEKISEIKKVLESDLPKDIDFSKVFRASGLAGGGRYEQRRELFGPLAAKNKNIGDLRFRSQVEDISRSMLGLGEGPGRLSALADVGEALHLKIQEKLKKDIADIELEKPIVYESDIAGPITGHIDAAIKNAAGKVEKVLDIKTVGQHFIDALMQVADATGTIDFENIGNVSAATRQKLETVASQLNLYIAGLQQLGESSDDISAEAQFFSREADNLDKPVKVRFKFDPKRLERDLKAVSEARKLVNDYIISGQEDIPEEYIDMIQKIRDEVSRKGTKGFAAAYSPEAIFKSQAGKLTSEQIDAYVDLTQQVYKDIEAGMARERDKASGRGANVPPGTYRGPRLGKITPDERTLPLAKEDFTEPLQYQFAAMRELHRQTVEVQKQYFDLDLPDTLKDMHKDIQEGLSKTNPPPSGAEFNKLITDLRKSESISFQESVQAWKLWRIAMGNWLSNEAKKAEDAFDVAKEGGVATEEFADFSRRVDKFREFIVRSSGKESDIYTRNRRFIVRDLAKEAGVYLNPEQLLEKSKGIFGGKPEQEAVRDIFEGFVKNLEAGGERVAPVTVVNDLISQFSGLNDEILKVLRSSELFSRAGKQLRQDWNFDQIREGAVRLREALQQYAKFNLSEAIDVEKLSNVQGVIRLLKQVESLYGTLDLEKTAKGPFDKYEAGLVKVPKFLPPVEQEALNLRNIQRVRERFARPEEQGGAAIGERFTYFMRISDQAGNAVKNVAVNFKKYGEALDDTGKKVGQFSEVNKDLIDRMHLAGGTFRSALRRVVMWGAAATLVYGGVQKLKDSIGELADIEVGVAQLRQLLNPLETDFEALTKTAVGFAKTYGTSVKNVLDGMKIFAQQGLKVSEVIDRTRVSTLAANVTTLSASDATEALTATMKVFAGDVTSAEQALDSWTETEARHAITAADMANAIKKAASAAKNAGFTFDELNGIVAGIGAVTRQTGKEVGTAIRFIARRLSSEKGPIALAQVGIPTVTGTGELRRGFDVLQDLSGIWDNLTRAQKLNISQALGGTRQYNALLVAMDNWNEVLQAVEDSTNSKGSAERRNVEIMKTYQKQLEQTRAAATELKLELGKFVFPVFKTGLKALKILLELMSAIPTPVKAAGVALTLFFGYASKGAEIIDTLSNVFSRGKSAISNFTESISKEFGKAKFEVLGKGFGDAIYGLKTLQKGAPKELKAMGLEDLHSGFGKLVYIIKEAGNAYNEFLAAGAAKGGELGRGVQTFGKRLKDTTKIVDEITDIFQLVGVEVTPFIAIGTQIVESIAKGTGLALEKSGQLFGATGEKIAKFLSDVDPSLYKSIAPLAISVAAAVPAFKGLINSMSRARMSSQEYAQSVYNARRIQEDQIKDLTSLTRKYDALQSRLEKINKVAASPQLKEMQQMSDKYKHPLLALAEVREDATKLANELAKANNKLVAGYDEHGNAILRLTGNYKTYIESLQHASALELAKTDIDILAKFTEELTGKGAGEKIKEVLKTTLGEVPGIGGVLKDIIKVSPAQQIDTITKELNRLLAAREQFPLSSTFDKDIAALQTALGKVKDIYDQTTKDFRNTLSGIFKFEGARTLSRDAIANLLADPRITKGFELLLEIDPKIKEVNRLRKTDLVKVEDIIGSEILKRAFPGNKAIIDYTSELTRAQAESAGIIARSGKKVASGDIITFFPELAKKFDIAGAQAIIELKETTDGVFEAFATYVNSKTLEIETRPLEETFLEAVENIGLENSTLLDIVENIFPASKIQKELEDRIDILNTFVAGAAAGLTGIEPKKFKREFSLGERFYSEIPTTTALQAERGFNVQTRQFGPQPAFQRELAGLVKTYFIEPRQRFNSEIESLQKNVLEGVEEAAALSEDKYQELLNQSAILRNNQVVAQFAAVLADMSKSAEESTRVLKENIAVEKSRAATVKITSGLLKGVPEGLDNFNVGIRSIRDLTPEQFTIARSPAARQAAIDMRQDEIRRQAAIAELEASERVKVALETILATQKGFESILGPDAGVKEVEGFIEKAYQLKDVATAELSRNINNLTDSNRQGFGNVVSRLETLISNTGDLRFLDEKVSSFEQDLAGGRTGGLAISVAKELNTLAAERQFAINKGEPQQAAAIGSFIDRLTDVLIQLEGVAGGAKMVESPLARLGAPAALRGAAYRFTGEEYRQRAFRRIQPNELIERFRAEAPKPGFKFGLTTARTPFIPPVIFSALKYNRNIADELEELKKLQEEEKKLTEKSFLDSKTIIKGSAALVAFEHFNKKSSNKVLENLKSQLVTEEKSLEEMKGVPEARGGIPEAEKKIAALKEAITLQETNFKFHQLTETLAAVIGGTSALSKALGISETNVKRAGFASAGLYLAMQAASKITGKDMPAAAKEFGATLVQALNELKSEGGLTSDTLKKLGAAGEVFEKQYGERVKEATGKTREAIKEQIDLRLKGLKDLSAAEIEARAEELRKQAMSKEGGPGVKALIGALTAATIAGTFAEFTEPATRTAELERLANKTAEVFNRMIEQAPETADVIAKSLITQIQEQSKEPGVVVERTNQLLDANEKYAQSIELVDERSRSAAEGVLKFGEALEKSQDILFNERFISTIIQRVNDFNRETAKRITEFNVRRQLGGPGVLTPALRGFPGEIELAPRRNELTTQQLVFATAGEKFQKTMTSYAFGLQQLEALTTEVIRLEHERQNAIEDGLDVDSPKEFKALSDSLSDTKDKSKKLRDSLGEVGKAVTNVVRFADATKKLSDAIANIAAEQAAEKLPGFKQFRDNIDKLLGGSHPEAIVEISPEQERLGRQFGIRLRHLESTRYDVELVNLLDQRTRATGEELLRIDRRIADLPETIRREIQAREQRTEDQRLTAQLAPYQELITDVQRIRQLDNLTPEMQKALYDYQMSIIDMLNKASDPIKQSDLADEVVAALEKGEISWQRAQEELDRIYKGGPTQRRGLLITETTPIDKQAIEIRKRLQELAPSNMLLDLEKANNPIVQELKYQSALLKEIAKAETGLSEAEIEKIQRRESKIGALGAGSPEQLQDAAKEAQKAFNEVRRRNEPGFFEKHIAPIGPQIEDLKKWWNSLFSDKAEGKAFGGKIIGPNGKDQAGVFALDNGEFVMPADKSKKIGYAALEYMRREGKLPPGKQGGGIVGDVSVLQLARSIIIESNKTDIAANRTPQGISELIELNKKLVALQETKAGALETARAKIIELNKADIAAGRTPQGVSELVELNKKLIALQENKDIGTKLDNIDSSLKEVELEVTGVKNSANAQLGALDYVNSGLSNIKSEVGSVEDATNSQTSILDTSLDEVLVSSERGNEILNNQLSILNTMDSSLKDISNSAKEQADALKNKAIEAKANEERQKYIDKGYDPNEAEKLRRIQNEPIGQRNAYIAAGYDPNEAERLRRMHASGGQVFGMPGPDKVPAYLTAGEYVIKKKAAERLGLNRLEFMNETGKVPGYADGGPAMPGAVAASWWDKQVKELADQRRAYGNFVTDALHGIGRAEGMDTPGRALAVTTGLTGQLGTTITEVGAKIMRAMADTVELAEKGMDAFTDSVVEKGFGGTLLDGLKGIMNFATKVSETQLAIEKSIITGEAPKKIEEFLKSDKFKNIKETVGTKLKEGAKSGDIFTSLSAVALETAWGLKFDKALRAAKTGAEATAVVKETTKAAEEVVPALAKREKPGIFSRILSKGKGTEEEAAALVSDIKQLYGPKTVAYSPTKVPTQQHIENLKHIKEIGEKVPNIAKRTDLQLVAENQMRLKGVKGLYSEDDMLQLLNTLLVKGTEEHELLGHAFDKYLELRRFTEVLEGRTPSKTLEWYRQTIESFGEMNPITPYAAQYKKPSYLKRHLGDLAKELAEPGENVDDVLKDIGRRRFKSENFAEFMELGSQNKLSRKLQPLYDEYFTPEKLNEVIGSGALQSLQSATKIYPALQTGGLVSTGSGLNLFGPKSPFETKPSKKMKFELFPPKQLTDYKPKTTWEKIKELLFGKPMPEYLKKQLEERVNSGMIPPANRFQELLNAAGVGEQNAYCGGGRIRRKYQAGGPVRKFTQGPGGTIYEVDEDGNILGTIKTGAAPTGQASPVDQYGNRAGPEPLPESFFQNKAFKAMQGEVDIEQPKIAPQDIARFAEETATETGRRFAEEARGLYEERTKATEADKTRAEIKRIQRENRRLMENDPRVREALRYPGLTGGTGKLGLFNLNLDEKTGLVGDEAIGTKFQSYYDLNELQYRKLKEAVAKGEKGFFQDIFTPAEGVKYLTPGYQPEVKKYFEERKKQQEALRSRLPEAKPGEMVFDDASTIFGGTTAKALTVYNKLKEITRDPNFFNKYDEKTQNAFLSKFDEAHTLLSGPVTREKDKETLRKLMRDLTISTAFTELANSRVRASGYTEEQMKAFENIRKRAKDAEDLREINKLYFGVGKSSAVIEELKNRDILNKDDPFFKVIQGMAARDIVEAATGPEKAKFGDYPKRSLAKYHSGGIIPTTGPIFAQAGEAILPRGFQLGGQVSEPATLRSTTIKIDSSEIADEIAAKIKEAIEGTEVKVDEDAKIKVDITDIYVPVDVGNAKVPVDVSDATVPVDTSNVTVSIDDSDIDASAIGKAIADAIGTVKIDVSGASVGADRFNQQDETIAKLDDRIIAVSGDLEVKIRGAQTEIINSVRSEVERQVVQALADIRQDISKHETQISQFNSNVVATKHALNHRLDELDRRSAESWTLANRPPTNTLI